MNALHIFIWIYIAMLATSFWEARVEGRNGWHRKKYGGKLKIGNLITIPAYHFYLWVIAWPVLLTLPLVIYGWDLRLFGIIASAYFSGMVFEDFMWYVVNTEVKAGEFYSDLSDHYPWLRIGGKKIIPWIYLAGIAIAVLSWYFLWR